MQVAHDRAERGRTRRNILSQPQFVGNGHTNSGMEKKSHQLRRTSCAYLNYQGGPNIFPEMIPKNWHEVLPIACSVVRRGIR